MVKRELEESGLAVVLALGDVAEESGASAAVGVVLLPAETTGTAAVVFVLG
jgi:hypothetical protein